MQLMIAGIFKNPVPSVMALLRPNGHFYDHVVDVQCCRELQELPKRYRSRDYSVKNDGATLKRAIDCSFRDTSEKLVVTHV